MSSGAFRLRWTDGQESRAARKKGVVKDVQRIGNGKRRGESRCGEKGRWLGGRDGWKGDGRGIEKGRGEGRRER